MLTGGALRFFLEPLVNAALVEDVLARQIPNWLIWKLFIRHKADGAWLISFFSVYDILQSQELELLQILAIKQDLFVAVLVNFVWEYLFFLVLRYLLFSI